MKRTMWLVAMACLASLPLTFIGCMSDEDLYDPAKAEARLKAEYAKKFVEKYGEITPDYSWDATSMKPKYASTREERQWYEVSSGDDWYVVEKATQDWIGRNLPDAGYNKDKGTSFVMTVPNNKFTLVPISQGDAALSWSFHVKIKDLDIELWKKGEDIQVKDRKEGYWKDLDDKGNTYNKRGVRARKYTFDFTGTEYVGEVMDFYLLIENNAAPQCAKKGTKQYSHNGMMLALDCDRPANIPNDKEVKIIGCEDANLDSDWDLNEVVFLMYGDPKVPDVIEIIEGEYTRSVTKRYMIEDLGSTDDFDFNDVVVDVTEKSIIKYIEENGEREDTEISTTQTATIRHLGGTLPFTLTIGNTSLPEMEGAMDVNPDAEYKIQGWIPEQNNISVTVKGVQNDEIHTVGFPENGEIPMIIAVDPTVNWMEERVSITKEWFDGLKK